MFLLFIHRKKFCRCIECWYKEGLLHLYSFISVKSDVGSLEVFIRGDSEFIEDLQPVFIKDGNQGDVWQRGDIYIDKRDEPFQVNIFSFIASTKL